MNEITTEERLRIVEELNRTANDSLGGESLQRAPATGGGGLMDTMEDILADCNEVFRYDETRPQDRAHTYLKEHRVCRGYDDTAMERAAQDMIERAYTVGRMESSEAVARETARIIAEGIAKELGITPGEE